MKFHLNFPQSIKLILAVLTIGLFISSCDDSSTGPDDEPDTIDVPSAYTFQSRFADTSSVAYPGQTVRYLLTQDLKIYTDQLGSSSYSGGAITLDDLLKFYEHDDSENLETITPIGSFSAKAKQYSTIATGKDLYGKATSPYADVNLVNRDSTADQLIRHYFQEIVDNSNDSQKLGTPAVYTTETGVNMSQMINKLLLGAVVYSQGTAKYLTIWKDAGNSDPRQSGEPFTEMEHIWDEAFGYFGAARNFSAFSDSDLANGPVYEDANSDGAINFHSEYNFTYATYAGKRDLGGSDVNFTQNIFDAFLEGRTAIVNQAPESQIAAQADIIKENWEKVVAANVVHYLNSTLGDMDGVTQSHIDNRNHWVLNEHWSEMKAFVYVLQYNDDKMISDADLSRLDELVGQAPPYYLPNSQEANSVRSDYDEIKQLMKSTYGFSDTNLASW